MYSAKKQVERKSERPELVEKKARDGKRKDKQGDASQGQIGCRTNNIKLELTAAARAEGDELEDVVVLSAWPQHEANSRAVSDRGEKPNGAQGSK